MKTRITVAFALVLALLLSLSFPAFAETGELPTAEEIENSGMEDLDELLRLREELAREKADLDRRVAAENGNRRIRLEPASVSVAAGESTVLTASVERVDADAPEKTDLVWSVGDTDVARVSRDGKVTGRKAGSTVVIAARNHLAVLGGNECRDGEGRRGVARNGCGRRNGNAGHDTGHLAVLGVIGNDLSVHHVLLGHLDSRLLGQLDIQGDSLVAVEGYSNLFLSEVVIRKRLNHQRSLFGDVLEGGCCRAAHRLVTIGEDGGGI